jgi:hypothetical protein
MKHLRCPDPDLRAAIVGAGPVKKPERFSPRPLLQSSARLHIQFEALRLRTRYLYCCLPILAPFVPQRPRISPGMSAPMSLLPDRRVLDRLKRTPKRWRDGFQSSSGCVACESFKLLEVVGMRCIPRPSSHVCNGFLDAAH